MSDEEDEIHERMAQLIHLLNDLKAREAADAGGDPSIIEKMHRGIQLMAEGYQQECSDFTTPIADDTLEGMLMSMEGMMDNVRQRCGDDQLALAFIHRMDPPPVPPTWMVKALKELVERRAQVQMYQQIEQLSSDSEFTL